MVSGLIRVTGGILKGRRLKGPGKSAFRPTTGRVKEFVFSYIGEDISAAHCLDLFSGTGSLGIEALSRCARRCVFIEKSTQNVNVIKHNLELCGFLERAQVIKGDVFSVLRRMRPGCFDFVFADPPFADALRSRIVNSVCECNILKVRGMLIIEHEVHDTDVGEDRLRLLKQRRFGHCVVSVYV